MKEKPNIITFDPAKASKQPNQLQKPIKKLPPNYTSSMEQPIVTIHVLDETNHTKKWINNLFVYCFCCLFICFCCLSDNSLILFVVVLFWQKK